MWALRAALRQAAHDAEHRPLPTRTLHPALERQVRVLCAEAHRAGLRPEGLLMACKPVLHSLPEIQQMPTAEARDALLRDLVSLCIREYFRTR